MFNSEKDSESLKKEILQKTVEYYNTEHKTKQFIPCKSVVPYGGRIYDETEMVNLVDSALDFWLTSGEYANNFEQSFAEYLGVKHCSLTNSGSSANLLAVSALTSHYLGKRRLEPGDEVITVAAGFPTTITPIIQNRLVPVFLDVEIPTYNIQVNSLEKAKSERTKAVMLAHTLGNPFNVDEVRLFCKTNKLWLIEDNCDALGSLYNNVLTGTFGHIATQSFYPPHHITMGEGGALVTNDSQLKKIIESFRDWGRDCWCPSGKDNTCEKRFQLQLGTLPHGYDHKYTYSHFGYNLKVTDMQAAIGCAQLEKLPAFVKARRKNFSLLYEELKKYDDRLILPENTVGAEPSWFGFLLTVRDDAGFSRDEIIDFLETQLIQTRMLFAGNMTRHPAFDEMRNSQSGYRIVGDLKNTDKIMKNSFWIGLYPGLTGEMISYMVEAFHNFMKGK